MSESFDLSLSFSEYDFSRESLNAIGSNIWVSNQWPIVYFIKNTQKGLAYVGESTNGASRIKDHLNNEKRKILNKVFIIGCDKFNKSATLHIESQLIQHISSEGTFLLQNGNNGLSNHKYYQQDRYESLFKEIWTKLIEKKVVSKSLATIQNTNFFKYSPYKSLNQDQYNSVLEIIEALNKKTASHIFVKGSAGTGKTILATYLIKLLTSEYADLNVVDDEDDREAELVRDFRRKYQVPSIALVISMTPLRSTLKKVFAKVPGLNKGMVISPSESFKKKYDILIVDEAHRLRQRKNISFMGVFTKNNTKLGLGDEGNELDWIVRNSKRQIFFYDSAQTVKPSDVSHNNFYQLLSKPATIQLELKSQMRVSAGADYINFVDNLLRVNLEKSQAYQPQNYELRVFDSFRQLYNELTVKEKKYELCRLIAGYAWPWVTKGKKPTKKFDIEIEGLKLCWNKTDKDWIGSENSFREVGCIHTTQGYDLNYAGVIFGKEITFNERLNRIEIDPEKYFDRYGKQGINDSNKLKEYIINIYKTLMYRGMRGTFIYACDDSLREYLQRSIHSRQDKLPFEILEKAMTEPYVNCIPLFDIRVAAGNFSELQHSNDFEWVKLPEQYHTTQDHFVCKVFGESMNKKIPNGSWCLFKKDTGGSREGKIVLVEHYKVQDPDFGAGFTIKEYHSQKIVTEESWMQTAIILSPLSNSTEFSDIILEDDELKPLRVIGVFVEILK